MKKIFVSLVLALVLVGVLGAADASIFYQKRVLSINNSTWTAVQPPIDCTYINVNNQTGVGVLIRTDQNSATTQDTLPNGNQETINSAGAGARFPNGQTIMYLQLASGGPFNVVITYVR